MLKVCWIKLSVSFHGVPDEVKVKVKEVGSGWWSRLVRRYKTKLALRLDTERWCRQQSYLMYCFTPPILFIRERKSISVKIKIRNHRTRASFSYRLGDVAKLFELQNIGLTGLSDEGLGNITYVTRLDRASHSGVCDTVLEESTGFSKDSDSVSIDPHVALKEPTCASGDPSVCVQNTDLTSRNPIGDVVHPWSGLEDRNRTLATPFIRRRGGRRDVPTTKQVVDLIRTAQQELIMPNFAVDQEQMCQDVVKSLIRFKMGMKEKVARNTYNSNLYYLRFERKIMEILFHVQFRWISFYKNVSKDLKLFFESLKQVKLLQIYTNIAEMADMGHDQVRQQTRIQNTIMKLIGELRMKMKAAKRLREGIGLKMKKTKGVFPFIFKNSRKTFLWLPLILALSVAYLFINYKVTGEVKQEVFIFAILLVVIFSISINFRIGRTYVIITTLEIVVKLMSRMNMLFIFTEFIRLVMILIGNSRRIALSADCGIKLFWTNLMELNDEIKEERFERIQAIMNTIKVTRERLAQQQRALAFKALSVYNLFEKLKNSFNKLNLLKGICKVILSPLHNYCGASVAEVSKDCKKKVGFLKHFGACIIAEKFRQFVCRTFYDPFNFFCNFDKEVKRFLNGAVDEVKTSLDKSYQQLKDEFAITVNVEHRFNHTIDYGDSSKLIDKSGIYEHFNQYIPSTEAIESLFWLVQYILMFMTFVKPLFNLWSFKKNLSFCNDCVGSKAFKKLDKRAVKKQRILPLTDIDKEDFRENIYSLPRGPKKKQLLLSTYWAPVAVLFLVMVSTFIVFICNIDTEYFLDQMTLSPESKRQLKETKDATRNSTISGIFAKSTQDFYKTMKKVANKKQERARTYAKKLRDCAPQLLAPKSSLLHQLYMSLLIVFVCNTLKLVLHQVYGRLLEHFFPDYKATRAKDLMDRIKEKRVQLAAVQKQLMAAEKKAAAKKAAQEKRDKPLDKNKKSKSKKKEKKPEPEASKKPSKIFGSGNEGKSGGSLGKASLLMADVDDDDNINWLNCWSRFRAFMGKAFSKTKSLWKRFRKFTAKKLPVLKKFCRKSKKLWKRFRKFTAKKFPILKKFCSKFWLLIRKLFWMIDTPFFLRKFICTRCLKTTKYQNLQECIEPGCGAALCQVCTHRCLEANHGKCPDCGFPLIFDSFLDEFPTDTSPTRSLCEVDLEPRYIDPKARFSWRRPPALCTDCGKRFVLNPLQDKCIRCRKGLIHFNPRNYEDPIRRPGDANIKIQVPGFDFLDSARPANEHHPVFY